MRSLVLALCCTATLLAADASKDVSVAMESLKQAMIHKDGVTLNKLLSDELAYTHSTGPLETKAEFIQSIVSGKSIVERLDYMGLKTSVYGDTALVRGNVDLYHSKTNIVHMNILHVWVKQAGAWKLVARQATRLAP
jgi:hypothetical protein